MCDLRPGDKGGDLADDLIRCGLLNTADRDILAFALQEQLDSYPAMEACKYWESSSSIAPDQITLALNKLTQSIRVKALN
ncbi:hypothetical protein OS493_009181 [Desmophyllum pertusum]|uniref:Uncharacterized protein n=1 Tax=Desmophyllum pertusum TaxID=174260 RepID=A0A9X0CUE8_9CNID|nr:hypothetical protein OS493_009181 [Desmophyllum pertusum]